MGALIGASRLPEPRFRGRPLAVGSPALQPYRQSPSPTVLAGRSSRPPIALRRETVMSDQRTRMERRNLSDVYAWHIADHPQITSPDWEKAIGPRLWAWEDEGLSCGAAGPHPPNRCAIGPLPLPNGRGVSWINFGVCESGSPKVGTVASSPCEKTAGAGRQSHTPAIATPPRQPHPHIFAYPPCHPMQFHPIPRHGTTPLTR